MTAVRVRTEDFEDGLLPRVCVVSGAPADRLWRVDADHSPRWPWLLIFLGPPGLVAAIAIVALARREASGYLPFTDSVRARRRRALDRAWRWLLGSAGVAVGGTFAAFSAAPLHAVGLVAVAAGAIGVVGSLLVLSDPPGSVLVRPLAGGRWVEVDRPSPAFAAAYESQDARRRAARQQAHLGAIDY
ncbi:MAG: hypothetical protein ABR511_07640 [Acidimicrobiales bacterium]